MSCCAQGANYAVSDLSYAINGCHGGADRDAWSKDFLRSYLTTMGLAAEESDVELLLIDTKAFHEFNFFARMSPWKATGDIKKLKIFSESLAEVLASSEGRSKILCQGLTAAMRETRIFKMLRASAWYAEQQAALATAPKLESGSYAPAKPPKGGTTCAILTVDKRKALQTLPGTSRLVLGEASRVSADLNQQWHRLGQCFQHAATGLYLDAEAKYAHQELGNQWESCGSQLFVKTRQPGSDNQRWFVGHGNACASPGCTFKGHSEAADWNGKVHTCR